MIGGICLEKNYAIKSYSLHFIILIKGEVQMQHPALE